MLKETTHLTGLSTGVRAQVSHTSPGQPMRTVQRPQSGQLESECLTGIMRTYWNILETKIPDLNPCCHFLYNFSQ